eukprot:911682-Rhodomonas_salina.2
MSTMHAPSGSRYARLGREVTRGPVVLILLYCQYCSRVCDGSDRVRQVHGTDPAILLHARYAMSGTDIAYAAILLDPVQYLPCVSRPYTSSPYDPQY